MQISIDDEILIEDGHFELSLDLEKAVRLYKALPEFISKLRDKKMTEIEAQIEALKRTRNDLEILLENWGLPNGNCHWNNSRVN